jgi:hypothetical protein
VIEGLKGLARLYFPSAQLLGKSSQSPGKPAERLGESASPVKNKELAKEMSKSLLFAPSILNPFAKVLNLQIGMCTAYFHQLSFGIFEALQPDIVIAAPYRGAQPGGSIRKAQMESLL